MKREEILSLLEEDVLQEEQELWKGFKKIGKGLSNVGKVIDIGRTSGIIDTRRYQ